MAGKTRDVQGGGWPLAGGFKLFPVDGRNWELCELRGRADGTARWARLGRFYSYNTVGQALAYVADEMVKRKAADGLRDFMAGVMEYRAAHDALVACVPQASARGGTPLAPGEAAGDRG